MAEVTAQPRTPAPAGEAAPPEAVTAAVDAIVKALGLKPAIRRVILDYVLDLAETFPKLPHVSFYTAATPSGGVNCRITYRVPGFRPRTERLGKVPRLAYKRAQRVSEVLQRLDAHLIEPREAHRLLYVDSTPIDTYRAQFIAALKARNNHADYVASQNVRLGRCFELGEYRRLSDITRESLPRLIEKLTAFIDPVHNRPISKSTVNDCLKVLRQFTRWATPALIPVDPLYNTTGVKNTDQVKRRDVLPEEVAAIAAHARAGKVKRMRMRGEDRAMLYLFAYSTGFRRNECRQLDVAHVKLDAKSPHITLPAAVAKNRKAATQPLPSWLAAELRAWIALRKAGPLWPYMPLDVAAVFDRDRESARQAWIDEAGDNAAERKRREESDFLKRETADGVIVFHSHRHGYSSQLLGSGMDLKTAQLLTRHATVSMLADRYAHSRIDKAAAGVEHAIKDPRTRAEKAHETSAAQSAAQQAV